ncbi:MAG: nucleotidyl transferase AbiEii/AbiGii toxin family protein [Candidatus Thermoplasmatota archaeon]
MITRSELAEVARTKRLSERNAERDYLIELALYSASEFGRALVLRGGTALYKFYSLNRFSEELDFTIGSRRFSADDLMGVIVRDAGNIGIVAKVEEVAAYKEEINAKIVCRGPLYDGSRRSMARITLNLSKRERPLLMEKRILVSSYKEIPAFEAYVLSPREILAEKVRAVMQRNKPREVYDLWLLLRRGEVIDFDTIRRKLKATSLRWDPAGFYRSLEKNRGMWRRDLKDLVIGDLQEFDHVLAEIHDAFERQAR